MTLPMTQNEKLESKENVVCCLEDISKQIVFARNCLLHSERTDFNSDLIVIAKNIILKTIDVCQCLDHQLHGLIDAPLWLDDNTTSETNNE